MVVVVVVIVMVMMKVVVIVMVMMMATAWDPKPTPPKQPPNHHNSSACCSPCTPTATALRTHFTTPFPLRTPAPTVSSAAHRSRPAAAAEPREGSTAEGPSFLMRRVPVVE